MMVADTANRVEEHTAEHVNERIQYTTEATLLHFAQRLDDIEIRLRQLAEEWDIERTLQLAGGVVISSSLLLSLFRKRWRLFSMFASSMLVLHALDGWCPPVPVLRRLGVRTAREINRERYGLKALRGDFDGCDPKAPGDPEEKARLAAGAVSQKFNPMQSTIPIEYEEPVGIPPEG
jgi:hypothetical protein